LKRIESRRIGHAKQRELDSKRLLQRNKNMMAVLEGRQASEEQRKVHEIRAQLAPPRHATSKPEPIDMGVASRRAGDASGLHASSASAARGSSGVAMTPSNADAAALPGHRSTGAHSFSGASSVQSPGTNSGLRSPGHARSFVKGQLQAEQKAAAVKAAMRGQAPLGFGVASPVSSASRFAATGRGQ
jgi:hypothetical protein